MQLTLSVIFFFCFCVQTVYPCSPSLFHVPESLYHVAFCRRGFTVSPSAFDLLYTISSTGGSEKVLPGDPCTGTKEAHCTVPLDDRVALGKLRWESLDRESRHRCLDNDVSLHKPCPLCVLPPGRRQHTLGIFRKLHTSQLLQHCTNLVKP